MERCDGCKNEYDKTFRVSYSDGQTYNFDSFECAIHMLAPVCQICGMRIVGLAPGFVEALVAGGSGWPRPRSTPGRPTS